MKQQILAINEQISICLHYVLDGIPHESFLGFCETSYIRLAGFILLNELKTFAVTNRNEEYGGTVL